MKWVVLLSVLLLTASAFVSQSKRKSGYTFMDIVYGAIPKENKTVEPALVQDDVTRFFLIGDYGQLSNYLSIRRVTILMNDLASQKNYSHIITAGDNFYFDGITNLNFRLKPWIVTALFRRSHIGELSIYPTLGNHDCHVNYENEVLYSDYNDQWKMEDEYYELITPMKDQPNKNFVNLMLNSCKLLCSDSKYTDVNECGRMKTEVGSDEVKQHYRWLEDKLQKYAADQTTAWLAVTLHHPPFINNGLKEYFLPLLRKYGVDFIFVGHEHWAEYANMDPSYQTRFPPADPKVVNNCTDDTEILIQQKREHTFKKGSKLHQFISGNGGHTLREICPMMEQDGDVYIKNTAYYGVSSIEATTDKVTVSFYKSTDEFIYRINVVR
jgi:hypothetical protein